jgi:hypothetical protein
MPDEISFQHFQDAMALIAARLQLLQEWPADDRAYIFVVESYALHLRKIVEGLAFAALSAFEHAEGLLQHLHRKDPDALLRHLEKKGLLALPTSADVARSSDPASTVIVTPRAERDLQPRDLYDIWTRASAHIHERHPERVSKESLEKAVVEFDADTSGLRAWLTVLSRTIQRSFACIGGTRSSTSPASRSPA